MRMSVGLAKSAKIGLVSSWQKGPRVRGETATHLLEPVQANVAMWNITGATFRLAAWAAVVFIFWMAGKFTLWVRISLRFIEV